MDKNQQICEDTMGSVEPSNENQRGSSKQGGKGKKLWKKVKYQLVEYHSLPAYLKDNEFILAHYRAEWPLKQVLLSIFSIHNETLNVWTKWVLVEEWAELRLLVDAQEGYGVLGLLNFIDGLWSASGGERIIIFTTNHVEKLDPALTRRGRMDMNIELSYCSFEGFKVLAKNYLELETHPMFEEIEKLLETTKITPADVAENLMPKSRIKDAGKCLSNLIRALEEARDAEREEPPQLQDNKQETQKTPSSESI